MNRMSLTKPKERERNVLLSSYPRMDRKEQTMVDLVVSNSMKRKLDLKALQKYGVYKHRSDFPPPGPEVPLGTAGNVELEGLGPIERIIPPGYNLLPVAFLEEGVLRQKAVARLPKYNPNNPMGTPWGTGFLVSNSLIMTNNHVIRSVAEAKDILVQFNYQVDLTGVAQPIDTWRLNPDNFFYTNVTLDFTLVRVKGKSWVFKPTLPSLPTLSLGGSEENELGAITPSISPDMIKPWPLLRYPGWAWGYIQLPGTVNYAVGQFLNCVQHPAGRMKEVALQQNEVTHIFTDRVHYTTDTEPGSSGSPVFNNEWDIVALHHAAGDQDPNNPNKWLDNEGMRIDSIITHLRSQFGVSNPGLLTELGIQ
jgi:endonuclease G, mitochondrial